MQHTKAKYLLICFGLCVLHFQSFCQNTSISDSLFQLLPSANQDTNKVHLLNDLAWELKISDPEKARNYLDTSVKLSKELDFKKGEGQAYNNRGVVETIAGEYDHAIQFYEKALDIRNDLGDQKGVASLYNNIGNLQEELDDHVTALENYRNSLRLRETLKDTLRIARVKYNIALVHESMGNYPEALDYILSHLQISERLNDSYEIANAENLLGNIKTELERYKEAEQHYLKALQLREELQDQWELAIAYNNMGNIKDDWGEKNLKNQSFEKATSQFQEALAYYEKSLKIYQSLDNDNGIGTAFNNIGLVHKNIGSYYNELENSEIAAQNFKTAHSFLNQSLSIREKLADKKGIMEVYNGIGDVYRRQQKLQEALQFTKSYLVLAEELADQKFIQKAYKDLSRVYADLGDYKNAYKFRKDYDNLRYERLDEERAKQNSRREAIFGDDKKQRALDEQKVVLQLQDAELKQAKLQRNSFIAVVVSLFLIALLLFYLYRIKSNVNAQLEKKNQIIEKEQKRSDELLLNILPEATAKELKQFGKTKAKYYDSVTVLFTDFESFTKISEHFSPEELVSELDNCYRAFDKITSKHGIEKIKTIGDSYMCAGGLPVPNDTHAKDVVNAAIEIHQFMQLLAEEHRAKNKPVFKTRIGIHTGPVVAGIVGSKKFAYDIWGDTVNTASRMESTSERGKINISKSTYELVKNDFICIYRGKIVAKKKGAIDMYFVETKVTSPNLV